MMQLTLAISKLILWSLRRTGRTGSALPGLVAERLYRQFLPRMLSELPLGVVVVTGTNGKTTTTKLIVDLLRAQELSVLTNQTGSNFERGISSVLVDKANLTGKLNYDIAIVELDEAHAAKFVERVSPKGLVALNIMRDQMDRFGEIDHTAELLKKVAAKTTDWLVLNANDSRISRLAVKSDNKKQIAWFGYDKSLAKSFIADDQLYHQDKIGYYSAHELDVKLTSDINHKGVLAVCLGGKIYQLTTKLEGSHNAINIVAALAAVGTILPKTTVDNISIALSYIEPAFGRGEAIKLKNGSHLLLQLVKNPGSFSYALHSLANQPRPAVVGIAINDNYADSRDVSWLWDVHFDVLHSMMPRIICGGSRGYDMAVRLKYEGLKPADVKLPLDEFLDTCINITSKVKQPTVIFCTYTAMLSLRKRLIDLGKVEKVSV